MKGICLPMNLGSPEPDPGIRTANHWEDSHLQMHTKSDPSKVYVLAAKLYTLHYRSLVISCKENLVFDYDKNSDKTCPTYGTGIEIMTSFNSSSSCSSSYSMLTSHCPSFSEGQQLTEENNIKKNLKWQTGKGSLRWRYTAIIVTKVTSSCKPEL